MLTIKLILFALFLCSTGVVNSNDDNHPFQCPSACVCRSVTVTGKSEPATRANCNRARFIKIPSVIEFPNNTIEVDFSSNDLTKIHVLDTMDGVTYLDLSVNKIDDISPFTFKGLKSLLTLDLSNNQLGELHKEVFNGLATLRVLNLSRNHLRALCDNLFDSLTSLVELQLSNNPLVHVNTQLLKPLGSLAILNLNQINANSLSTDNFHFNKKLTELHLSANKFVEVPIDGIRSAVNLRKLYFNGNQIQAISRESFAGLTSLEELYVSQSQTLTHIAKESFTDLHSLRVLSITPNKELIYIEPFAFYRTFNITSFKLEEVYLNDNWFTELDETSLLWCQWKVHDLRSNHWNCDCTLKWIKKCPNQDLLVSGVRCQSLSENRGIDVEMSDSFAFNCPFYTDREMKLCRLMVIVLGSTMLLFITALLAVLIKRDDIAKWWRERSRRKCTIYYVKPRTAPNESVNV